MKRRIFGISITLLLSFVISYGHIINQPIEIEGEYEIVGISRNEAISWSEFTDNGFGNHGTNQFTFSGENRLSVNQELAEMLFDGNKEFTYQFLDSEFILISPEVEDAYKFTYELDGDIINLSWEHPYFTGMQLLPVQ